MSKEAQLAGISPYVLRLAAHYACLGVGTYLPKGYAQFDRIEVLLKQPWQAGQHFTESCLILCVEFYVGADQLRYVEFALTPAGFSGRPVVQLVVPEELAPSKTRLHAFVPSPHTPETDICDLCGRLRSVSIHSLLGE